MLNIIAAARYPKPYCINPFRKSPQPLMEPTIIFVCTLAGIQIRNAKAKSKKTFHLKILAAK